MSDHGLPTALDDDLDSEMSESDFVPESLPTPEALSTIVSSEEYQSQKPKRWEKIGLKEAVMVKILFLVNRFWSIGDSLDKHWLGHRANHANFLSKTITTEVDGEPVAYSVTGNESVCSSCVEFFNVIEVDSRKLVRSCPGSVTFGADPSGRSHRNTGIQETVRKYPMSSWGRTPALRPCLLAHHCHRRHPCRRLSLPFRS